MQIAIIGAGPTGIFTALLLKNFPGQMTLFEQNTDIGQKLKATGGGRMNLDNQDFTVSHFWSHAPQLLKHFFKNPVIRSRSEIFQKLEIEYQWEGHRAILKSQNAPQEVQRLKNELQKQTNLHLQLNCPVLEIRKEKKKFLIEHQNQQKNEEKVFDAVILCTGGSLQMGQKNSMNTTGYHFAKNLGHQVTKIAPALGPIKIFANPFHALSGISLPVDLTDPVSGKKVDGDMLFTHQGISGPAVLDFTTYWAKQAFEINFLPSPTIEVFSDQFQAERQTKTTVIQFLATFFPRRFSVWLMELAEINPHQKITETSKAQFKTLRTLIFHYQVPNGQPPEFTEAWTTKGGLILTEIFMHSLESKYHQNLFFGGEILDITGLCGGYNIALAAISSTLISEEILDRFS